METESGMGTGTRVGRESRIVKRNLLCETEQETEQNPKRETERETERDPKRETERETEWDPKRETERETERDPKREMERETERDPKREMEREMKRETKQNPKRETEREGGKAPNLTNVWYLQNTGCCVPIYSRGLRWPLYTQDRLTTQISIPVPPSSRSIHSTRTPPRYSQSIPL